MCKLHIQGGWLKEKNNSVKRWLNLLFMFNNLGKKQQVYLPMQLLQFLMPQTFTKN
jgi:hypothetical protein